MDTRDWMTLFNPYTRTHRKNGRPYVAEAAHPDNGSWEGHDTPYHSEHYFHSAYTNLVITGVAGLRPRADDSVEVNPLAPRTWPYFALDDVRYHGRRLSVLWDSDGTRYGRGAGFMILADGQVIARAPGMTRLVAHLGPARAAATPPRLVNVAVNNGRGAYPWIEASYASPHNPPTYLIDGNYWYHTDPPNRWTTIGTRNARDTVMLDFGAQRTIQRLALYVLDDGPRSAVRPPARYEVQAWRGDRWMNVARPGDLPRLEGRRANVVSFPPISTSRIRIVLTPQTGTAVGLSELEAWSADTLPLSSPTAPPRNLAFNDGGGTYPQASSSFTFARDSLEQVNDAQVAFTKYSRNRWTAYQSPNTSDWVAIDFGTRKLVSTVELYLFGDDGGIKAPRRYVVQVWDGKAWKDATVVSRAPERPLASARNVVRLRPVRTSRVRVVFEHSLPAFTGLTELVIR